SLHRCGSTADPLLPPRRRGKAGPTPAVDDGAPPTVPAAGRPRRGDRRTSAARTDRGWDDGGPHGDALPYQGCRVRRQPLEAREPHRPRGAVSGINPPASAGTHHDDKPVLTEC